MITYLFVNMIDDSIENKEIKIIDQQTAERLCREEEQRRIDQTKARVSGALSNKANTGTTGRSQGVAGGTGNQGVESGAPDVPTYGPGGGPGTNGISFDLGGRMPKSLFKPPYNIQKDGIVVVAVIVDRSGRVTDATPGIKGSTTLDENLLKLAKEAALKTEFESSNNAPIIQKGTITYDFRFK
ncbi:MAG: energy transducer TonB [Bacteroidales bacterium]|nr:energy transducer TonB [Bacteroidales bacterium]